MNACSVYPLTMDGSTVAHQFVRDIVRPTGTHTPLPDVSPTCVLLM